MADDEERSEEQDDGLSTPQKVLAGAALGVAVPTAVGVARKLLGGGSDETDDEREEQDDASSEPTSRERRSSSRSTSTSRSAKTKSKPKAKAKAKTKTTPSRTTPNRTREQLYRQATRLKIEGRSSMNKTQLERAVARAKAKK